MDIITQFIDCQIHCITSLTHLPRLNLVKRMDVAPKLCIFHKYLTEVLSESNSAIIDRDVMLKGADRARLYALVISVKLISLKAEF